MLSRFNAVKIFTNFMFLIMIQILYFLQRFNVAVTRAKALLIVIGNPELLCRDRNWKK